MEIKARQYALLDTCIGQSEQVFFSAFMFCHHQNNVLSPPICVTSIPAFFTNFMFFIWGHFKYVAQGIQPYRFPKSFVKTVRYLP